MQKQMTDGLQASRGKCPSAMHTCLLSMLPAVIRRTVMQKLLAAGIQASSCKETRPPPQQPMQFCLPLRLSAVLKYTEKHQKLAAGKS